MVEDDAQPEIEVHACDPTTAERQIQRTRRVRAERDEAKVCRLLDELVAVARDEQQNIMPVTIDPVRNGATISDIVETLKGVWSAYRETPVFSGPRGRSLRDELRPDPALTRC